MGKPECNEVAQRSVKRGCEYQQAVAVAVSSSAAVWSCRWTRCGMPPLHRLTANRPRAAARHLSLAMHGVAQQQSVIVFLSLRPTTRASLNTTAIATTNSGINRPAVPAGLSFTKHRAELTVATGQSQAPTGGSRGMKTITQLPKRPEPVQVETVSV
eukprot:jgi/Chlat1/917/Chrsp108S01424